MNGDVFLFNNNELCFENTINWKDILSGEGAVCNHHFDSADPHRHCELIFFIDLRSLKISIDLFTCTGCVMLLFI